MIQSYVAEGDGAEGLVEFSANVRRFATLAVLAALPGVGSRPVAADGVLELPELVVTETRTPLAEGYALADVTVLDREAIERRQPLTLPDLLRGQRGLAVASAGGAGKQASLCLRGTGAKDVLVLVDGVRAGSATGGGFAWEFLPVAELDRVEIVRGPRSSLYGPDAVGGVVQVFTRRAGEEGTVLSARAGAGNRGTLLGQAGLSASDGGSEVTVHASGLETEGANARRPALVFGTLLDEPDRDGYRNHAVSGRLAHRFGPAAAASLHVLHAEGSTEYDGFPFDANETDFTQEVLGGRVDLRPLEGWQSSVTVGRSLDRRREYREGGAVPASRFDTESRTFSWQNDFPVGLGLLTVGADRLEQRVDSSVDYDRRSRSVNGAFVELQARAGAHRAVLGGRLDDNSQFGTAKTGNLAWGYELASGWEAVASWGTAFRAPTFNELYYPGFGNPDLRPERSHSVELSVAGRAGEWRPRLSVFRTRIHNLVAFPAPAYVGQNVDRAEIDGLELELTGSLGGWEPRVALTWLDPRDRATGDHLPRRPQEAAVFELDRLWGPARVGLTWVVEGARYDDPANRERLGGFGVLDLRGRYRVAGGWTLEARAGNVLDHDYETVAGYPESGRSLFFSIGYTTGGT